jgi:hypothetical protein
MLQVNKSKLDRCLKLYNLFSISKHSLIIAEGFVTNETCEKCNINIHSIINSIKFHFIFSMQDFSAFLQLQY